MKKFLAIFVALLVMAPVFSLALIAPVSAATATTPINENTAWGGYWNGEAGKTNTPGDIANKAGLSIKDPREIAANVINVILGFLGIIAVVLILIGGFMWMTAAGNEDKTGTAKKIMTAGVIGLVIILAAFGIARFVIQALISATV
ncbi:MAG: hypothetical protein WCV41_01470 [Patescibacteria group bacterium]